MFSIANHKSQIEKRPILKVSIIIPALNEAAAIQQTVERAIALRPFEVIVVDGGSHDGTDRIASQLDCKVCSSDRGRARQQNAGAAQATGDVLLFLHADCWLDPAAYEQIERTLRSPLIVGGAFYQRIEATGLIYRTLEVSNALRVCCTRMAYGDQGLFLRRELFEQLGGFPDVRLMEDVLLVRKLRARGRLALLPGPLFVSARRWQKHGLIRQTLRNWYLLAAEQLGVHPDRLADFYAPNE